MPVFDEEVFLLFCDSVLESKHAQQQQQNKQQQYLHIHYLCIHVCFMGSGFIPRVIFLKGLPHKRKHRYCEIKETC